MCKNMSHVFPFESLTVTQAGGLNDFGVGMSFGLNLNLTEIQI